MQTKISHPKSLLSLAASLLIIFNNLEALAANQVIGVNTREPAVIDTTANNADPEVELNIKDENKLKINVSKPIQKIDSQAFSSKEEMMQEYFQLQKGMDSEDIQVLWSSTVDRNPVIKFALKKLASPPDQRKAHSSLMVKTVSALISGASILPGLLGADSITSSATSAGGTIAKRALASTQMPKNIPLTDTELIHLARLVEDLQDRIIKNYYQYRNDLEALKMAHQEVVKQNIAYSVALRANDKLEIMATKVLYDNALKDEMNLKRDVKIHMLELERLAGTDAMNTLRLGKIVIADNVSEEKGMPLPEEQAKKLPKMTEYNTGSYVDVSVCDLAKETSSELQDEMKDMLSDLSILWGAAIERSETIKFAILKLSNPDGKVEKTSAVKRILSPLAGVASVVGLGMGDPVTASGAIFSGNFLNSFLAEDNAKFNARLSKVTDTDLVLLAQETDNLQQKLVTLYCAYTGALLELDFANKIVQSRKEHFDTAVKSSDEYKSIADVFYKEAVANQYRARQNVLSARLALEQFVGNEAIVSIDKNIQKRLSMK